MHPEDVKYSKSHEWVKVLGDLGTVGITEFAKDELGDIVNVELPAIGATVRAGDPFGSVDSVKAVSDIMSPVTGEVVERNDDIVESPELINEDPYGAGWMIIVKLSDPAELDDLMTSDEYEQYIEPE